MLLTYVDESYTRDRFYLAAVMCDGAAAAALTNALGDIAEKAAGIHGLEAASELHGYEIFHGTKTWTGVPPRQRIGIYDDVCKAVGEHATAVILRGVNLAGLRSRYKDPASPHTIVLQHLLERVDAYATLVGKHALVIADEVEDPARHRADLIHYRRFRTPGYRSRRITRIVDTVYFIQSHASRLVQAADMVAFLHHRRCAGIESDARAARANDRLWARISPKVVHEHCWEPVLPLQMHEGPAVAGPKAGSPAAAE